jgi:hypothetical protein
MKRAIVLLALGLGGCVTAQAPEEPQIFGRIDCRRATDSPDVLALNEQAEAICKPRAEAAAIAGTSSMPTGRGWAGAIVSGINQGITQNQIAKATVISCMAEQGYLLKTRSEHEAMCEAMKPKPKVATVVRRVPRPPRPSAPVVPPPS